MGAAIVLAGCANTGGASKSGGSGFFGRSAQPNDFEFGPDYFRKQGYCPPVEIRTGTESIRRFERDKEGDPASLRFQGALDQPARQCTMTADGNLTIKLGLRGRVVAGPKGGAGTVNLPIRVAVIKQGTNAVFFSQLYSVPVTVSAPSYGMDFSQVFDQISFPVSAEDRDLVIYAGFDSGQGR